MPNPHKNKIILASSAAPSIPLLDGIAGAKAAYSFRKLRSASTNAVRVRRSTDNAEATIGFAGNDLDRAALLSFAAGGNAYINLWYDQSGNGQHAMQTAAGAQPQIVSNGELILDHGKPTCLFDGINDFLIVPSSNSYFKFLHDGTVTSYIFSVQRFGDNSNPEAAYYLFTSSGNSASVGAQLLYDNRTASGRSNSISGSILRGVSGSNVPAYQQNNIMPSDALTVLTSVFDGGNATAAERLIYHTNNGEARKGNVLTNAPSTASATIAFTIGKSGSSTFYMLGALSEMIFFGIDQSANRTKIINNLNTYYATY